MSTHVYADANIFLDFFRFSEDDLGELEKLAGHLDEGNIVLYLPQLTAEEYFRNRDKVVLEQFAELKRHPLKVGIPIFIRESQKAKDFQKSLDLALVARNELLAEIEQDAALRTFRADGLISSIFAKAVRIETAPYLVERAQQRLALGNPPGKSGSIGDRLNWESLLEAVPIESDLHLLTRDGDYLTSFPVVKPNMFILSEWKTKKIGQIHHYKGIKAFAKHIDDSITFQVDQVPNFPPDPYRTEAINYLSASNSFSHTHDAIALLDKFSSQLSPDEMETILEIAIANSQVGGIMGDEDLHIFYLKVRSKMPWFGNPIADKFDDIFGDFSDIPF